MSPGDWLLLLHSWLGGEFWRGPTLRLLFHNSLTGDILRCTIFTIFQVFLHKAHHWPLLSVRDVCFQSNCFQGAVCANPCPAGTFGDNCREKCECYNSASCHHQTGRCECPPGYRGELVRNERPLVTCSFIPSSPSSLFLKIIYVGYGHNFR